MDRQLLNHNSLTDDSSSGPHQARDSQCLRIDWPAQFATAESLAARVNGWLLPSEIRFLTLAAAMPTVSGSVVELGAYHGKSTAVLALGTQRTDRPGLISVDPYDAPERDANLRREHLDAIVDFRPQYSHDFWREWSGPIRLLWHDGANDRKTVREDVRQALSHLADGAIIAFHDVRNPSGERLHAFLDEVLASPHFGRSGVCGTIGWSQYRRDVRHTSKYTDVKRRLQRSLERLRPYHDLSRPRQMRRLEKYRYKVLRWFVPQTRPTAQQWAQVSLAACG